MTVYFSKTTKEYAKDKKALAAVKETINNIKNNKSESYPIIEAPYICRIDYVPLEQISDFAKNYYKKNHIIGFYSIFPALDKKEQKEYYKKMYRQGREDFFICTVDSMNKDTILEYIEKSVEDDEIAYFSILIEELPLKERKQYAKKQIEYYYKTDDYAWFSILLDYLSYQEKKKWLDRADDDGDTAFYSIISNEL